MSLNWVLKSSLGWSLMQLSRTPAIIPASAARGLHPSPPSLRCWHAQHLQAAAARQRTPFVSCAAATLQQPIPEVEPAPPPAAEAGARGHIELVLGPMFAGKTSELLRRVEHYEAQGLSVAIVKSDKDNRYSASHVVTHDGVHKPCFAVPTLAAFREAAGARYLGFHVIAVDEAQFFPDLLEFCTAAADEDAKRVILAGLDGDFQRQRFGQVLDLVPLSDSVTKLTATCTYCQAEAGASNGSHGSNGGGGAVAPAVFSLRIAGDALQQEVVGGADKYAPVCRRHYVQLSGPRCNA